VTPTCFSQSLEPLLLLAFLGDSVEGVLVWEASRTFFTEMKLSIEGDFKISCRARVPQQSDLVNRIPEFLDEIGLGLWISIG